MICMINGKDIFCKSKDLDDFSISICYDYDNKCYILNFPFFLRIQYWIIDYNIALSIAHWVFHYIKKNNFDITYKWDIRLNVHYMFDKYIKRTLII